jgi:hypothetical protein
VRTNVSVEADVEKLGADPEEMVGMVLFALL